MEKADPDIRTPSVRLVVLDADISESDLSQLASAIRTALKPRFSADVRRASASAGGSAASTETDHGGQPSRELHRVTIDPDRCGGRPCLRDLRIRVRDVLDLLAAGADRAEILADHPSLEDGDITAALEYAARHSDGPTPRAA